jgi:transposase InsO family protein
VDRSKALSHNNFGHSTEILLAKHCLSLSVPKAITVDNGTQFDAETFKDFYDRIGTKIHFASVRHPKSNGLVERANGIIMTRIMKLIFNQPRGKWPNQLIKVVWSHKTTVSRSTGFTPFKLLFGDEAITPEEAKTRSIRKQLQWRTKLITK